MRVKIIRYERRRASVHSPLRTVFDVSSKGSVHRFSIYQNEPHRVLPKPGWWVMVERTETGWRILRRALAP